MYSYEDRIRAVNYYIYCGYNAKLTVRKLGYPSARMLAEWYREYSVNQDLHQVHKKYSKFTDAQKRTAIDYYFSHGRNALKTVRELGYPSRTLLCSWVKEFSPEDGGRRCNPRKPGIKCSQEDKIRAVVESCKGNLTVAQIAEIYGVTPSAVSVWRKELLGKGRTLIMENSSTEAKSIEQLLREKAELESKIKNLELEVCRLELERDVLEKAGELLKKEKGISLEQLTNREKTVLIDALRKKYRLKELLCVLNISKSSYCYQKRCICRPEKYRNLRMEICDIFRKANNCYGYRRIHASLKRSGFVVSEKVIRRLMREENLTVWKKKNKKYCSYIGEISPAVKNFVNRNFHAEYPNTKWLTDITEFSLPAGKVYLSPIIDCFDGLAVSWTIGTSPTADLANTMLDKAISFLNENEHPIVHSDRGGHYRWPGWIQRMEAAGLTRSMSKKGCSPDNSACEGFFGRLKNEMFYGRTWTETSIDEFIAVLDDYIHWYNESRIKESLGWMSPLEYRRSLGITI